MGSLHLLAWRDTRKAICYFAFSRLLAVKKTQKG